MFQKGQPLRARKKRGGSRGRRMLWLSSLAAHAYGPRRDPQLHSASSTDKGGIVTLDPAAVSSLFVVDLWSGESKYTCEACECSYQHVSNPRCQEWLTCKCDGCVCGQSVTQQALGYTCKKDLTWFDSCTGCLEISPPPPSPPIIDTMVRQGYAAWKAMVDKKAADKAAKAANKSYVPPPVQQAQAESPSLRTWECMGDREENLKHRTHDKITHGPATGKVL